MKRIGLAVILALLATNVIAQTESGSDDPKKERLGLRIGYVGSNSGINNTFGDGLALQGHFLYELRKPLFIDFTLGAFYLGSTDRDDITRSIFNATYDKTAMRVLNFTIAPTVEVGLSSRLNFFVSAGGGLYIVSLLLDEAVFEFDIADNHFGVNASTGIVYKLSENWSADLGLQLHKLWTSDSSDDLFFRYSESDTNPLFYAVSLGLMLYLF